MEYNEKALLDFAVELKRTCENHLESCHGCPFCKETTDHYEPWCKIGFPMNWEV